MTLVTNPAVNCHYFLADLWLWLSSQLQSITALGQYHFVLLIEQRNMCKLVGRSSPHCGDIWRTYCCLTSFFPIVDTCLNCEDIARQSCAMVPRWRFLATFLRPVFSASHVQQVSDLHLKFALRQHHVWKYCRHPICSG